VKRISIIKDALRNMPHAIAIDDDSKFIVKSLTEFGNSLIDGVVSRESYATKSLPAGFVATDFKEINSSVQRIVDGINFDSPEVIVPSTPIVTSQKKILNASRFPSETKTNGFRSPSSRGIDKFKSPIEKINIVDFKARLFSSSSRRSEVFSSIKNNQKIGFDKKSGQLISREANSLASIAINRIVERIGQKAIVRAHVAEKTANPESPSRRANRHAEFLVESKREPIVPEGNQRLIAALQSKLGRKI
jgi:hypothetical protein